MLTFLKKSSKITISHRWYSPSVNYNIPQKYRNAFYLANAPLFDYINWFVHRAYEICFPYLVETLLNREVCMRRDTAAQKVLDIIKCLEPCGSIIDISFPIKCSDGHQEVIRGFRAMHCSNLYNTPCLGGMRICSDLTKDHIKAFSVLSTFKHACLGIQMSGAHGGIKISGFDYDPKELKNIVVSYGKELARRRFLGSFIDVMEPDLYCGSQEMEWIAKEFSNQKDSEDKFGLACAVGKPWSAGGLQIYDKCLAHSVLYALQLFMDDSKCMEEIGMDSGLAGKKYIIQGLGKIGSQIVLALDKVGVKCVGIKEHDAFIYMEDGIPVQDIVDYKRKNDSIQEFNKYTRTSTVDEIYMEPCDILIFAATHRSLQCYVAENVRAKIVVEAAHAPITPTAHKVLLARKRLVLPDIFAGCGASVTSYLEYVKNLQHAPYNALIGRLANLSLIGSHTDFISVNDEYKIKQILESMMKKSFEEIREITDEYKLGLDVRSAAYINGIKRIFAKIIQDKKY